MNIFLQLSLALLVFASSFAIDAANTRFVQYVQAGRRLPAANWSALQWMASMIGFVVAVKVSFWYLPLEGLGLWLGSYWAISTTRRNTEPSSPVSEYEGPRPIGFQRPNYVEETTNSS